MQAGTGQHLRARVIDSTLADIRFAVRHAVRKPLTALTIIAVLAIGIGVHSAVFSLVQAVTTRPAPGVPDNDALVRLRGKEQLDPGGDWYPRGISYSEFLALSEHRELFAATAAFTMQDVAFDLANGADAGTASAQFVTGNFFTTLGLQPALGAGLPPTERADQVEPELQAVISHTLWQAAFGSSPTVIGQTVRLNNVPVRVVGVAPARFNGAVPTTGTRTLWLPLSARAQVLHTSTQSLTAHDTTLLQAFARLNKGVSIAQANTSVGVVASRAVSELKPRTGGGIRTSDVVPLRGDSNLPVSENAVMLATVYGSVAFLILLITCTNVSALVVGSATTRRQEIAIRLSLGASRQRVIRQLLTESVLLSTVAGAVGLLLYWWIVQLFASQLPDMNLTPNLATAAFTLCFALGTGVLFGLSPALHATRSGLSETLKDSTAGAVSKSRLQRGFVVAQIVFTQPLLAGLAMLLALVMQDGVKRVGSDVADHVLLLQFNLYNSASPKLSYEKESAALESALQRVATEHRFRAVAEPSGILNTNFTVKPVDRGTLPAAGKSISVHVEATSPGYFGLLDIPILSGRDLSLEDSLARDMPVVIDSDLATQLWGNAPNAVGRHFIQKAQSGNGAEREVVVVGVYDARFPTTRGVGVRVYAPQNHRFTFSYLVRTEGLSKPQLANIRGQVRAEIPNITISRLETLADVNRANDREALRISGAAAAGGALALLLASIGLYGVVALALGQRRREIGVRLALGARPQQVVSMLFSSGVRLSVIGLVIGLPVSMVVLKILAQQAQLPNISLAAVGAAIGAVVVTVASIATWLPARHAARVDPVQSLRAD
ncbi:MAG: ABC transporter permease [Gemmatimonas sp.]